MNKCLLNTLQYIGSDGYVNEMTKLMDSLYLTADYQKIGNKDFYTTYIVKFFKQDDIYLIRKFGATRGCLRVDENNTIIEIKIYEENGYENKYSKHACYKHEVLDFMNQWIGWSLKFDNRYNIYDKW